MPNYTKLEQELLSADQLALTRSSRGQALAGLDDPALDKLIADLEAAIPQAAPPAAASNSPGAGEQTAEGSGAGEAAPATEGEVLPQELLARALRRATTERRKRERAAKAAAAPAAGTKAPAPPKAAKRAPASPARKPVGREKLETRKADLRTGVRRVNKAGKAPAADKMAEPRVPAGAPATPAAVDKPAAAKVAPVETVSADQAKGQDKAARKAERKAAKQAEKDARKAETKAMKQAEKAARQVEKAARKAVDKAEKAERKAAKAKAKAKAKAVKDKPAKGKPKPKPGRDGTGEV